MKKSVSKFLSIFLMLAMLLASSTVVFAEVTVTSSVANDAYLKVGENVVLTFSAAITEEQAETITVTKVGDENATNLVADATVADTVVNLSFGDNLEYSNSYKITVPAGVTTSEWTSYFTTYNKYHRGINKVIVDENFNSQTANALPYTEKVDADDIANLKIARTVKDAAVPEDTSVVSVKNVANSYGQNGNSLYAASSTSGSGMFLFLENYNARIASSTAANVDGVVISFKFKDINENLNDMRMVTNGSVQAAKFTNWAVTGAGIAKEMPLGSAWHEYTMEVAFNADNTCKIVNAAIDGEAIDGTQNFVHATLKATDFRYLYIQFVHWAATNAEIYIDDIKIYEPVALAATNVTAESTSTEDTANVNLAFNNPVDAATLSNITVADESGNAVTPAVKASNDLKSAALSLTGLAANTKYTIIVPNSVKDVFANAVTPNSFEVETKGVANPQLIIGSPVISGTVAAGETITAKAELSENTTSENVEVTLAIALYNGIKLVDVNTLKQTFTKNAADDEITVSLDVPNDIELKNYEVRAFVLDDDLNSLATTASLKN